VSDDVVRRLKGEGGGAGSVPSKSTTVVNDATK